MFLRNRTKLINIFENYFCVMSCHAICNCIIQHTARMDEKLEKDTMKNKSVLQARPNSFLIGASQCDSFQI